MELLSGDKLGKYEIVGRLAAGGMAEVYLARSIGVGGFAKTVALKRMLPDLAQEPGYREMFMHEASIVSRLNHGNIVQIFDFAEERGELYLTMEFVHGVTLRQLLRDVMKPPALAGAPGSKLLIPPMLAAHIGRGIARALAHAWQVPDENGQPSRLIHRDVSPHNVLLSYDGDVKLADFGIAKPVDRRTSVGTIKGKLVYMAPEQISGGELDARTDVFALGIVLYETATNKQRALFEGGNQREVMQAIHKRQIPPPDRMDPDFPKSVSAVIMKALEREPANRFQSAAELADALGECIHKEAKSAHDVDLGAFMRQVYGEPPPVRGLRPISQPPTPVPDEPKPAQTPVEKELERRANDPDAATLTREQAEELGRQLQNALPKNESSSRATIRERRPRALIEQPVAKSAPVAKPAQRAEANVVSAPASSPGAHAAELVRPRLGALVAASAGLFLLGFVAVALVTNRTETPRTAEPVAQAGAAEPVEVTPADRDESTKDVGRQAVENAEPAATLAQSASSVQPVVAIASGPLPAAVVAETDSASSQSVQQPPATGQTVPAARPVATEEPPPSAQAALPGQAAPAVAQEATAPARKPVRRAPAGKGSLWVQVTPWAFVAIDNGKKEEVAPAKLFDGVPAGVRTIELSNDAGFSRKLKVVVRPNERARLIGTIQDAQQVP